MRVQKRNGQGGDAALRFAENLVLWLSVAVIAGALAIVVATGWQPLMVGLSLLSIPCWLAIRQRFTSRPAYDLDRVPRETVHRVIGRSLLLGLALAVIMNFVAYSRRTQFGNSLTLMLLLPYGMMPMILAIGIESIRTKVERGNRECTE